MNVKNTTTTTDNNTKEHVGKISFSQYIIGRKGLQISEDSRCFCFRVASSQKIVLCDVMILSADSAHKIFSFSLPGLQHIQMAVQLKLC